MTTPSRCRLTRARIEPVSAWQFQFTDTNDCGFVADILAIADWSGDLVELAAWKPGQPNKWWLRDGNVPLLGEDSAELSQLQRRPVWLAESPAAWWANVSAGRDAACVLNWSADPRLVLTGLNMRCSPAMDRRLRQWWAQATRPTFSTVVEAQRVAA